MSQMWRRNLWAVWIAEFLSIMGFSCFTPLLTYYVQYLGVEGDAVETWAGAVISAPFWAMAIMGPIWGALSDRYGRKVMVERAMFSGFVIALLMGFARNVEQMVFLRFVQGALTGTVAAATTLVASATPRERLGETLGQLQLAIFLGQSLGPIVGGFVGDYFGYPYVFWMTAVFLLVGGLIILFMVHEDFQPSEQAREDPLWKHLSKDFGLLFTGSLLVLVLALRFLLRVGVRLPDPMLPLLVEELLPRGGFKGSASGLLVTVSGLTSAVAAPLLGRLADRHGGRTILLVCAWVGGAALFFQALAPAYTMLLVCQAFLGIAVGGTLATLSAYVGRLAPEGRAGAAYGLDTTAVSISNAIGPFAGGWLARWFSLRSPFTIGGVLMALSSLAVLRLPKDGGVQHGA